MDMSRNIGIYLAYSPFNLLRNQGIIRLFLFLLQSPQFRRRVVIAMPGWNYKQFVEIVTDAGIPISEIEVILSRKGEPPILAFNNLIRKIIEKIRGRSRSQIKPRKLIDLIQKFAIDLAVRNFLIFILLMGICAPIILSIEIGIALVTFSRILKGVRFIRKRTASLIDRFTNRIKTSPVLNQFFYAMRSHESDRLIRKINKRADIDLWYAPTGFWSEISKINKKKVVAIPDIVFFENPVLFFNASSVCKSIYRVMKGAVEASDKVICYSHHVKENHLVIPMHLSENKVKLIKHGNHGISNLSTQESLTILEKHQNDHLKNNRYLSKFHLPSMKFLFFSSQIRPYKNVLRLIKAYEILLRKRAVNIKLILTGSLGDNKDVKEYVENQRLENDVLSFFDVSNEVLAALNQRAICAVNPTTFEGGFPFTFAEAYSVGTPSVMSRIPVVLEEIDDEALGKRMLFDPLDTEDMADKIEWAIHNREALYKMQAPLYEKFRDRTWDQVAKEYLDFFDSTISESKS